MPELQELKALAEKQLEASVQQGQDLSSELAALQQAQQSSSQAIAAELAALKNLTMTRNQQVGRRSTQAGVAGLAGIVTAAAMLPDSLPVDRLSAGVSCSPASHFRRHLRRCGAQSACILQSAVAALAAASSGCPETKH